MEEGGKIDQTLDERDLRSSLRACEGCHLGCSMQGPSKEVKLHESSCLFFLQEQRLKQMQNACMTRIDQLHDVISLRLQEQQRSLQTLESNLRAVCLRLGMNFVVPPAPHDPLEGGHREGAAHGHWSDQIRIDVEGQEPEAPRISGERVIQEGKEDGTKSDNSSNNNGEEAQSLLGGIQRNIEMIPQRDKHLLLSFLVSVLGLSS